MINFFLFLGALVDFLLAGLILFKTDKENPNKIFAYCSISFGVWTTFILLFRTTNDIYSALFFNQMFIIAASFIPSTFLHFILNTIKFKMKTYLKLLIHFPNAVFITGVFIPGAMISKINIHPWGKESVIGPLYHLFNLYFSGYILLSIGLLIMNISKTKGSEKLKLKYILWTTIITSLVGTYFNLYLVILGNYKYIWVGPYNSLLMSSLITFAILKINLLNIKLVFTRAISKLFVFFISMLANLLIINILWSYNSLVLTILACTLNCWAWISFGEKLRLLIQTPLEKAFLVNSYNPSMVMSEVNSKLAPVFKINDAIDILSSILKDKMEISTIEKSDSKPDDKKPAITLTHGNKNIYLVFGKKLSEDPYSTKDLNLIKAVEEQLKIIQDRILKHETLERINIENEKQIKEQVEVIIENERHIQSLEKQRMRAERIADLSQMIQEYNHEIKTPQTALMSFIEILDYEEIEDMNEQEWEKTRDRMKGFIRRTIETVNTTLQLTPRKTLPDLDTIDINTCIDEVLENYTELKSLDIQVNKGNIRKMMGVKSEIKLILNNLIKNSIDAFREAHQNDGKITITTTPGEDKVILIVEDNGPGIPKEFQDKIWNIYSTSRRTTGTGLGLPTVQARVMEHDGTIELESEEGKGSKFTITFTVFVDYGEFENGEHITH
jgi:signal transduction histidine kinase